MSTRSKKKGKKAEPQKPPPAPEPPAGPNISQKLLTQHNRRVRMWFKDEIEMLTQKQKSALDSVKFSWLMTCGTQLGRGKVSHKSGMTKQD